MGLQPEWMSRGYSFHPSAYPYIHPMKSFSPSPDVASYKDLLLFEERLKQNAALLRSRKNKYQSVSPTHTTSARAN